MDIDEFIDVERQDPIGGFDDVQTVGAFQRGELDPALVIRAVVADVFDLAHLGQPVEHCIGAVLAIVGKHQEVGKAHRLVMGQPVEQEGGFVTDAEDRQKAHQLSISRVSA